MEQHPIADYDNHSYCAHNFGLTNVRVTPTPSYHSPGFYCKDATWTNEDIYAAVLVTLTARPWHHQYAAPLPTPLRITSGAGHPDKAIARGL